MTNCHGMGIDRIHVCEGYGFEHEVLTARERCGTDPESLSVPTLLAHLLRRTPDIQGMGDRATEGRRLRFTLRHEGCPVQGS